MRWLFGLTVVVCRGDPAKNAELLVLRHENAVLRRNAGRVRYEPADRAWLAALTRFIPRHRWAEVSPVTPATLLAGFQKSRLAGPARPLNGVQGHRNRGDNRGSRHGRRAVVRSLGLSARPAGPSPPATQPIAELAGNLPVGVPPGDCLPLVKGPPTARQGDLHLHPAILEVQRQRHERDAGVAQPPDDLVDLAAVQEQLAGTPGLVERAGAVAAVRVLGDVQAVEHQLAVVRLDERAGQRRVAGAQGLHLVTDQDYPGLPCPEDRVVMPGPPVRGDEPAAYFPGRGDLLVIRSIHPAAQGTEQRMQVWPTPGSADNHGKHIRHFISRHSHPTQEGEPDEQP
jgi:hypothetical protein